MNVRAFWATTAALATAALGVEAQTAKSAVPSPATSKSAIPADAPIYARQGMWFSAGVGAGAASLHCQICEGEQGSKGTSG